MNNVLFEIIKSVTPVIAEVIKNKIDTKVEESSAKDVKKIMFNNIIDTGLNIGMNVLNNISQSENHEYEREKTESYQTQNNNYPVVYNLPTEPQYSSIRQNIINTKYKYNIKY